MSEQEQGPSVVVPDAPDQLPAAPEVTSSVGSSPPRTEAFAATSLILGILGLALPCFWLFPAPQVIAIILGHISVSQTRAYGTGGRGMGTAGLILGYLGLALALGCLAALLVGALTSSPVPA